MEFLRLMPTLIRRKFVPSLVLLLLIPLIILGDFSSGYGSTNSEEKAKTEVNPYVTTYLNFTTAIIDEITPYIKSFLNYATEEVVPPIKSFVYYTEEEVKKKIIPYFNRCLNSTGEVLSKEVIPYAKSLLHSGQEIVQKSFPSLNSYAIFVGVFCKEHPSLFLVVVLIICCVWRLSLSLFPAKMMKAPGRNYKISRANFERNPGSYFRRQRQGRKKSKPIKILAVVVVVVAAAVVVGVIALR
ncbi:hypothetical protein MKW94_028600 [Papaver nudicaule]|uniref:Transmembrane protein n=1 Tax=Papaver nudicaule TaxID=74823 RepID=A0AA41VUB3_PAPNU|nr:hypothetical protein [Papaver nudicaule]